MRDAPGMTTVEIRLPEDRLDITALNISFGELPVGTASAELVRSFGGDLEELEEALRDYFADGDSWCRVGNAVHTVTSGDAEVRLTPQVDAPPWHADLVHVGWESREGARIPPGFRPQYTKYVDRRRRLRESCLQVEDLRAEAAIGGAVGVDRLVGRHRAQLAAWYEALDHLLISLKTGPDLPGWAAAVAREELLDWHRRREYLTCAVLEYHHGGASPSDPRPDTVFGNLCFQLSTGCVELAPDV